MFSPRPHIVALADDDSIFLRELLQISEGRTKHRVSGDIAHTRLLVKLFQIRLHTGDVADDTFLGEIRDHLLEDGNGVFQRNCVDEQFGLERLDFLIGREALTVVGEAHPFGVALKDSHFVVKAQQVDEE